MATLQRLLSSLRRTGASHKRSTSEGSLNKVPLNSVADTACGNSRSSADLESSRRGPVKRVIVVVDHSEEARCALLWALSHVVHRLDTLTLLHVSPLATSEKHRDKQGVWKSSQLTDTLTKLCVERRPEVEVETLVVQGARGPSIVAQAKKLEASLIVLGQKKRGLCWRLLCWLSREDDPVEYCIHNADCLTLAVRRKSRRLGGYLINSKWQKNFWLLA